MKSISGFPAYYKILFFVCLVVAVVSIVYMIVDRFRLGFIAYSLCLLFIYLSSNHLEGVPRYISVIIPMYFSLACLSIRVKFLWESVVTAFSLLLAVCFALFVCGYWMV